MAGNNKETEERYGMTEPIDRQGPTADEERFTENLKNTLEKFDCFDSEEGLSKRILILRQLNDLVKRFVQRICHEKNPHGNNARVTGKIYTFGSYRLGVHTKGADIDTLCVVPQMVDREDFFTVFVDMLRETEDVTEVRPVAVAFVPLIKLYFDGIEMDILFARLNLETIHEKIDLKDSNLLRNLDEKCVRSLNGCRVTDEILHLVPNIETFRLTLRAIKLWARRKMIYSNAIGFLGGVSWAMLTARICQLYPNQTPAILIEKFFKIYTVWPWPKPILLKTPDDELSYQSDMHHTVWDPRYNPQDRLHLMPIITPAYPQQNSTYNVTRSTLQVMNDEFQKGLDTMTEILDQSTENIVWDKLFSEPDFFGTYKHFLALTATAHDERGHQEYCGMIESKIRILVQHLEKNPYVVIAHAYPEGYHLEAELVRRQADLVNDIDGYNEPGEEYVYKRRWFIGLKFARNQVPAGQSINLTDDIQRFQDMINMTDRGNKQDRRDKRQISTEYCKKKELAEYLPRRMKNLVKKKSKSSVNRLSSRNMNSLDGDSQSKSVDNITNPEKHKSTDINGEDSQKESKRRKMTVDNGFWRVLHDFLVKHGMISYQIIV